MATKTKSTKLQKREAVVPFVGEEQFVVPKKERFWSTRYGRICNGSWWCNC